MNKPDFFAKVIPALLMARAKWPGYQAAEAALESGWGESQLTQHCNNLWGQKAGYTTAHFEMIQMPTREYLHGDWEIVPALWPRFDSWMDCAIARQGLLNFRSRFALAMESTSGEDFVRRLSAVWATDPQRADTVLMIYRENQQLIEGLLAGKTAATA